MSTLAAHALDSRPDPFAAVLGHGRGRGQLPPTRPVILTEEGIELEIITSQDGDWTYAESLRYRDFELSYDRERTPTKWFKGYKWTITGYANGPGDSISNHDADERICAEAAGRGVACQGDSESGQLFIHARSHREACALVDIAHDLGLTERPPSR